MNAILVILEAVYIWVDQGIKFKMLVLNPKASLRFGASLLGKLPALCQKSLDFENWSGKRFRTYLDVGLTDYWSFYSLWYYSLNKCL